MADPSPWQLANAGQKLPHKPAVRPIFSHGTELWPYMPGFEVISHGTDTPANQGLYGVNAHQQSTVVSGPSTAQSSTP